MKKAGKAGLGRLKKMEKKSRQMLTGRAALASLAETKKVECKARRRCGLSACSWIAAIAGGREPGLPPAFVPVAVFSMVLNGHSKEGARFLLMV